MVARVAVPALDHQRDALQDARRVLELIREVLERQEGAHAGRELDDVEGLGQIIVRAQLDRLDLVGKLVERGEHDDRDETCLRILFQRLTDGVSVAPRHHDVAQDEVGRLACHRLESLLAVGRLRDPISERLEDVADDLPVRFLIVHHEDARTLHCSTSPRPRAA